jgi:hypothetical protein
VGGYDYCQNPPGTRLPAGCVCGPSPTSPASPSPSPAAANANAQLLADAQTMLQNAGRISKSMTDAMDVTKHNNVGIGVALGATFGAMGKMIGVAAQQYRLLAAAGNAAAQDGAIVQIAGQAATESGVVANQAATSVAQMGSAGSTLAAGTATTGYLEGAVLQSGGQMAQGDLPICAVLSCVRLGQLLGRNIPIFRFMENFVPKVNVVPGQATVGGGLTAQQVATGLKATGINAEVGSGMTDMMNKVRAGTPVIAGVSTTGAANAPLHALVIQSVDTSGPAMLTIYDPVGNVYTQAAKTFAKYFTGVFVTPLP